MSRLDEEIAEGLRASLDRELTRAALELAIPRKAIRVEVSWSDELGHFVWLAFVDGAGVAYGPAGATLPGWGENPIEAIRDAVRVAGLCGAKVSGDSRRPCTRQRGHRGRHLRRK